MISQRVLIVAFLLLALSNVESEDNLYHRCKAFKGTSYFLSVTTANFQDAKRECERMKSTLVILDNEEKSRVVTELIRERDRVEDERYYWIDGFDATGDNKNYVWQRTGKSFKDGYINWCCGEPNRNDERCVNVEYKNKSYCWCDVVCDRKLYYICERRQ